MSKINKVRLPAIWSDAEPLSDEEQLTFNALGRSPDRIKTTGTVVIKIEMVESWFADKNCTKVNLVSGDYYVIDIDEPTFAMLYQEFSNTLIRNVDYTRSTSEDVGEENEEDDYDGDN